MRHLFRYRVTFTMALLIVAGSALFAWIRSHDIAIVSRKESRGSADTSRGEDFFVNNCRSCHAALPHLGKLASAKGGREYLVELLLYGIDGKIVIKGSSRELYHPPFGDEADDDIATTLNYMMSQWGNEMERPADWKTYGAKEIAESRARVLTPEEVHAKRVTLDSK